jgi:4-phytase / acid phosphatase
MRMLTRYLPLLACLVIPASVLPAFAAETNPGQVRLEIVLMRHGVRSPTTAPEKYAEYASAAWPAWPVAPGMLTTHGEQGMRALGTSYRQRLIAEGVLPQACPAQAELDVIGDSTPRNRASAAALVAGLAPDCGLAFRGLPSEVNNPLFHYREDGDSEPDAQAPALSSPPSALVELQRVLLGCNDTACLTSAQASGKKLLLDPEKAGDAQAIAKAMKSAGSLSENLMLGYAQGMPLADVAWGRADAAVIGRLITLHNAEFNASKKSQPAASRAGSNLMAHILATLESAAGRNNAGLTIGGLNIGDVEPLTPSSTRVLFLVGHDTNLANIAGVLGVSWHDASRPDDYPPGGALVFDLVENNGHFSVRTRTLMPTLDALRDNRFDTLVGKPVAMSGCKKPSACTLDEFVKQVGKNLDASRIDKAVPQMK